MTHQQTLENIKKYFNSVKIPTSPIQLNKYSTIIDCQKFINSHIKIIELNRNQNEVNTHFDRLRELKKYLDNKK